MIIFLEISFKQRGCKKFQKNRFSNFVTKGLQVTNYISFDSKFQAELEYTKFK